MGIKQIITCDCCKHVFPDNSNGEFFRVDFRYTGNDHYTHSFVLCYQCNHKLTTDFFELFRAIQIVQEQKLIDGKST